MNRRTLFWAFAISFGLLSGPLNVLLGQETKSFLDQSLPACTDAIIVELTVWGQELTFLADSGSTTHVFDNGFRDRLGEPTKRVSGETTHLRIELDAFPPPQIWAGDRQLKSTFPVVAMDLGGLSKKIGLEIDGILGIEFFLVNVIEVDWPRNRLLLHDRIPNLVPLRVNCLELQSGESYDYFLESVELSKDSILLKIDTGLRIFANLESSVFENLAAKQRIRTIRMSEFLTASGPRTSQCGNLDRISIGGIECKNVEVSESNKSRLGLGFFSEHRVFFDLGNNCLLILPAT